MKLKSCTLKSVLQHQYSVNDFIREAEVLNVNQKLSNLIPLNTGEKTNKEQNRSSCHKCTNKKGERAGEGERER